MGVVELVVLGVGWGRDEKRWVAGSGVNMAAEALRTGMGRGRAVFKLGLTMVQYCWSSLTSRVVTELTPFIWWPRR